MTHFNKENNGVKKNSNKSMSCSESLSREIIQVIAGKIGSSPESICFDSLRRFKTDEDRRGEKSGWYLAFQNNDSLIMVLFGDWRKAPYNTWHNRQAEWYNLDSNEREKIYRYIESRKREYHAALELERDTTAEKAKKIFEDAKPVYDYDDEYLSERGVLSFGLRKTPNNVLLIPISNFSKDIRSLLFIKANKPLDAPDRITFTKKFLYQGEKAGCFFRIPGDESGPICIGEGYSTCASIHMATGYEVYCALDCHNIKSVAQGIRKITSRKIIICADNDIGRTDGNIGVRKALEAAWESEALVAVPKLEDNHPESIDFNDLYCLKGPAEVKTQVCSAKAPDSINIEWLDDVAECDIQFVPSNLPPIGHEAFYGLAGDAVRLACISSEADPVAVLGTFLVRFGVEIGREAHIAVGDTNHYANEYVAVIGRSSKARKGTSAKPVDRFFDIPDAAKTTPGPLSTGEGIVYAVRNEVKEWNVNKQEYQISDPGISDKRLYVNDPELGAALKAMKREGNTLSAYIRCLFDSGSADPLTKSSKTSTSNAHVGILAHCTEMEMRSLLSHLEAHTGFANRFLWISASRKRLVPIPEPMSDYKVKEIQERIIDARSFARSVKRVTLDAEARAFWIKIYPELSAEIPGSIGSTLGRAEAHVLRLSLIYALLDKSDCIKKIYLDSALAFWKYTEASVRHVFQETQLSALAEKIYQVVKEGPVTATELSRKLNGNSSKAEIEEALKELESIISVDKKKPRVGRKPITVYRIKTMDDVSTIERVNSFNDGKNVSIPIKNIAVKSDDYSHESLFSLNSCLHTTIETPERIPA